MCSCVSDGKGCVCLCDCKVFVCSVNAVRAMRRTVMAVKFEKSSDQIIASGSDTVCNVCWY